MRWLLKGKGLLDYALGKHVRPENPTAEQKALYAANNDKALAIIGLSIDADQQIHIEDCNDAHEAWMKLEQIYEPKSRVCIMQLKKAFYHLKMKDDENMSAYVSRAKIAANNLREAGAEAKDEDLAYALLAGLPESYESLNMSLASLPDDQFNSAEIIKVLLAEYDRRLSRHADDVNEHKEALHTTKRFNKRPNKDVERNKGKQFTCFNCNKIGHLARDCRMHINKGRKTSNTRNQVDAAFLLSLNSVDLDDTWLLDSGCTHHVSNRKDWFMSFEELNVEMVNTAADPQKQSGATLHAKGVGKIILRMYVGNPVRRIVLDNVYYVPHIRKNLMSVSQIEKKGYELMIKDGTIKVRDVHTKKVLCIATRNNDLYAVKGTVEKNKNCIERSYALNTECKTLWHERFCHINYETIKRTFELKKVTGYEDTRMQEHGCDACYVGKACITESYIVNSRDLHFPLNSSRR